LSDTIDIKVPDIGDFHDVPVIEVLVAEGDRVNAEDGLVTLESDKATMEVPSPLAGTIRELRLKVGDTVSQGAIVAVLELTEAGAGQARNEQASQSAPEPGPGVMSDPERPGRNQNPTPWASMP
jgi:pyruvate/2-oxoglutarate dehydrogenase complex dihydrolipoamide acyltransferase (E2) component